MSISTGTSGWEYATCETVGLRGKRVPGALVRSGPARALMQRPRPWVAALREGLHASWSMRAAGLFQLWWSLGHSFALHRRLEGKVGFLLVVGERRAGDRGR